jgi:hypothetical protein
VSSRSLICVGPTGLGYFCDTSGLPVPDMGVVANSHGALLVCDAPIVAFICSRRSLGNIHLVTNNLGSVECDAHLIREKLGSGVTIHSDPSPFTGAPIDMIFIDRGRGTRSYVTTNYYPSTAHIASAADQIRESLSTEGRTVLYVDIEVATDGGRAALESSPLLAMRGASLWNVGGVAHLADVEAWLEGSALPEHAVIQVSLLDPNVAASELEATYQRVCSATGQTLIATLGGTGAAWTNGSTTEFVEAAPIPNGFTLAAGAVLSSSLVMSLAEEAAPNLGQAVSDAVRAATTYVHDATSSGDMHHLRIW